MSEKRGVSLEVHIIYHNFMLLIQINFQGKKTSKNSDLFSLKKLFLGI